MKKMEYGSPQYESLANARARSFVHIVPCYACGRPTIDGYACQYEKCPDPMGEKEMTKTPTAHKGDEK